ncbi:MAG: AbrB/MazE/SpoVT family DNA-binding domain-containing protein [Verrucomicrobiales bacterium]
MKAKLSRWGNSLAVRIPSPLADEAQLREGTSVDIAATSDGGIRLTPLKTSPTIEDLVAGITDGNRHEGADWGEPVGNEAW